MYNRLKPGVRGRRCDLVIAVASRKGFGRDRYSVQTAAGNNLNHQVTESLLNWVIKSSFLQYFMNSIDFAHFLKTLNPWNRGPADQERESWQCLQNTSWLIFYFLFSGQSKMRVDGFFLQMPFFHNNLSVILTSNLESPTPPFASITILVPSWTVWHVNLAVLTSIPIDISQIIHLFKPQLEFCNLCPFLLELICLCSSAGLCQQDVRIEAESPGFSKSAKSKKWIDRF